MKDLIIIFEALTQMGYDTSRVSLDEAVNLMQGVKLVIEESGIKKVETDKSSVQGTQALWINEPVVCGNKALESDVKEVWFVKTKNHIHIMGVFSSEAIANKFIDEAFRGYYKECVVEECTNRRIDWYDQIDDSLVKFKMPPNYSNSEVKKTIEKLMEVTDEGRGCFSRESRQTLLLMAHSLRIGHMAYANHPQSLLIACHKRSLELK